MPTGSTLSFATGHNTATQSRTRESTYVVWQKQLNQGSRTETLTLPSFTGTVNTPFKAPGGITVQIPEGDMRSQNANLRQQEPKQT